MRVSKIVLVVTFATLLFQSASAFAQDAAPAEETAEPAEAAPAPEAESTPAEETATAEAEPAPAGTPIAMPATEPTPVPEAAPIEEAPAETFPVAGWDKGFFIQSNDGAFKLKLGGRIKTLYTFQSLETPSSSDRANSMAFAVPYARLYFSGHLFDKRITYLINPGFAGNPKLVLAFSDVAVVKNVFHVTLGRMKRPFSRNYLTSSGKRAFINGPIGEFGRGVDHGIQISNNFTKVSGFEWALGVFNGSSGVETPAITARLGFNTGLKGYHPTDFEGGGPRFGFGVSFHTDTNVVNETNTGQAFLQADLMLKVAGFSLSGGSYLNWQGEADKNGEPQWVWEDPTLAQIGSYTQAQFLIAKKFEPVFRWDSIEKEGADNGINQFTLGFTVYFYGQNFKWENNVVLNLSPEEVLVASESDSDSSESSDSEPETTTTSDTKFDVTFMSQIQFLF